MRILILLSILPGGLMAQTPAQQTASTADSTEGRKLGRVEGVVMNSVTNAPLARATVMLRSMGRPGASSAPMVMAEGFGQMVPQDAPVSGATGADGKFVIQKVPEGQYMAMASRANFLPGNYAERAGVPTTITVGAGSSVNDITIKLMPQGVISGRVTDAEGEPIQNVMVTPARYTYMNGQKLLTPAGQAQTNDLGEYRVPNLAPGKYFLIAGSRTMAGPGTGQRESLPTTFYPNALEVTGASQISVDPGAEVRGMDFRLKKQAAVVVSGKITGLPEGGMTPAMLIPLDESLGMLARMSQIFSTMMQTGKFSFSNVPPGTYEVRMDYRGGAKNSDPLFGRLRIEVGNQDMKDLEIVLAPGAEVVGSIRVEGGELPTGAMLRVALRAADGMSSPMAPAPEKDLSFKIPNVVPGKYIPNLIIPPGFYVKAMKIDDREGAEQMIEVGPQAQIRMEILLAAGGGEVSGTVEGEDGKAAVGAYVSVHPTEAGSQMRTDREKSARTDAKGRFTIKGLAPGSYRVFAWDSPGNGEWRYEGFRKEYEGKSATVKLTETGKETATLKAIAIPK